MTSGPRAVSRGLLKKKKLGDAIYYRNWICKLQTEIKKELGAVENQLRKMKVAFKLPSGYDRYMAPWDFDGP